MFPLPALSIFACLLSVLCFVGSKRAYYANTRSMMLAAGFALFFLGCIIGMAAQICGQLQ